MNVKRAISLSVVALLLLVGTLSTFSQTKRTPLASKKDTAASKPLVTFVELGSVNCIPCKAMQSVMKAVEAKYGDQVKVIFYDVWTKEQAHQAREYNVRVIPTQVFLDANGKEFHRHEGFYPEEAIDLVLHGRGLEPRSAK